MFEDIVRRAKRQARQAIILSTHDSDDLREAAAIIENVADNCHERLARSLSHMLDRLNRIIAAGDYHRNHYCFEKDGPKPIEYMTTAELAREKQRLENKMADSEKEITALKGDVSGQ
jgi:hypothetical protein